MICLDPFHAVMWAMKALDKVRTRTMTTAGITDRHAMWATRKNPSDLSGEQRTSLAEIAATNKTLYRAYLLKEQLREMFRVKGDHGRALLAGWLSWASHSRIPEFAKPTRRSAGRSLSAKKRSSALSTASVAFAWKARCTGYAISPRLHRLRTLVSDLHDRERELLELLVFFPGVTGTCLAPRRVVALRTLRGVDHDRRSIFFRGLHLQARRGVLATIDSNAPIRIGSLPRAVPGLD